MAFRLTIKAGRTSELVVKKTRTASRGAPVELVLDKTIPISREETKALLETLEQSRFWDLATEWGGRGLDGTIYIVEGIKNGKYHIVERSSGGSMMGWALMLMNKSGEDYRPIN